MFYSPKYINYASRLSPLASRLSLLIFLFCSFFNAVHSQDEIASCGTDDTFVSPPRLIDKSIHPFCDFLADHIKNSCLKTYVNVNVHFFVDDNCLGETGARRDRDRIQQHEAFQRADDFIRSANEYLAEISENNQLNQSALGAMVTDTQCVAIRYLLNEVYIHCEADGLSMLYTNLTNVENDFLRGEYAKGLNIFISDLPRSGSQNPDGFAYLRGTTSVVETFSSKLVAHEVAHNLDLYHTFEGPLPSKDGCLDTPVTSWEYDQNGDGTIDSRGAYCWARSQFSSFCTPNGTSIINVHPCCNETQQDNNVMTYSIYSEDLQQAAFTPCQMDRMLEHLIDRKCDLIEDIDPPCPPTSAFIGKLPSVDLSTSCNFSLYLNASSNETDYRITYSILQEDGNFTNVSETDWIQEEAGRIQIAVGTNINNRNADVILLPKTTYRIVLSTRNSCGNADQHAIEFKTPECGALQDEGGGVIVLIEDSGVRIFPNPTYEGTRLEYTLNMKADIEILFSSIRNDGTYGAPVLKQANSGHKEPGSYIVDFQREEMGKGINFVIIRAGEEVHVRRVIQR